MARSDADPGGEAQSVNLNRTRKVTHQYVTIADYRATVYTRFDDES